MERIHRICRRLRHDGWRGEKLNGERRDVAPETGAILWIPA